MGSMGTRTWPILDIGFGCLLALILLFSISATRKSEQIQAEIDAVHETYRNPEQALNELHSDFYLGSLSSVRDFLLDSYSQSVPGQRQIRSALDHLQLEMDVYWEA